MRKMKGLVVAALAVATAGCVQSMDQGYGYGNGYYGNGYNSGYTASSYYPSSGYYGSPGYYATPSVNNYYYNPSPTVVTQTRYVPTPVAVPTHQADRSNDNRWSGHRDNNPPPQHVDRPHPTPTPQANNTPRPTPTPNTGNRGTGNGRDRDGDGKPDRPDRRS